MHEQDWRPTNWSVIHRPALGEQEEFVEKCKCLPIRVVDARDDNDVMAGREILNCDSRGHH